MVLETLRYLKKESKACLTLEDWFVERETFRFVVYHIEFSKRNGYRSNEQCC